MPETTCALNSWSLLFCARWMRPASSGLFCAMFSRMAACIAAPSAFMPADARVVATAVVVLFMVLPFGVVLSFYLLLYTVWRASANLFRYFLLSLFRVRQPEASGVGIIATATTFAANGGNTKRNTRQAPATHVDW